MDARKFDELTKTLATNTSRRRALKTISASVVGGAFGLSSINVALAKLRCKSDWQSCSSNSDCCSNFCNNGQCKEQGGGS